MISFISTCPVGNASSRELARAARILVAGALFCLPFLPGGAARPAPSETMALDDIR